MDIDRKKRLLQIANDMAVDINRSNAGNFVPLILNAIKIAKNNGEGTNKIGFYLIAMKKGQLGGRAVRDAYDKFINNYQNSYHRYLSHLSFDELEYVFAWTRKIVKTKR